MQIAASNGRLQKQQNISSPKHDINFLLGCFNQLDRKNTGVISKQSAVIFFRSIQVTNSQAQLDSTSKTYEFDDILSILGKVQAPEYPSVYVIAFVRVLAQFRNKCLQESSQEGDNLVQAEEIDKKVKRIMEKQIQNQSQRMQMENGRTFQEMESNQDRQYKTFETQWNSHIAHYSTQNKKKVQQTIQGKNRSLYHQQTRFGTARRYSVVTSTKLTQLQQKKKRLVKQGKYNQALTLKQSIFQQKQRISSHHQNQNSFIATKRFQSLRKKNQSFLQTTVMTASNNMKKLVKKKQQGQQIMRIRMKSIREETAKKLNQTVKKQIGRLKSLFYEACKG